MTYKICFFVFILFFQWFFFITGIDESTGSSLRDTVVVLDLLQDEISYDELVKKMPNYFIAESVTYKSDIYIDELEFKYLTQLQSGDLITHDRLIKACSLLAKKNKFSALTISLKEDEKQQKNLFFDCKGMWTFRALTLKGLVHGIEKYRHYYLLEPGEIFDYVKHKHSLKKIKEILKSEGFLDGKIYDYLEYDIVTKTVTTVLILNKGIQFIIGSIDFSFIHDEQPTYNISRLRKKLHERFSFSLNHAYYSQELLNKQASYLYRYLTKKGFLNAVIKLKQKADSIKRTVNLHFEIILQQKKNFIFFGNHFFSNQQLLEAILAFGHSAEFLPESLISEEIMRMYYKKGFHTVVVDVKHEQQRKFFLINEGPRIKLQDVIIEGSTIPSEKLKSFFKACIKATFVDEDLFKQALYDLIAWYHKEGFPDVEIVKQEYISQGNETTTIAITLKEGARRYFRSVNLIGREDVMDKKIIDNINYELSLKPFDVKKLQEKQQVFLQHLQKQGLLYTVIKADFSAENTIDVTWTVTGNQIPIKFGKVIIQGSSTFPFENVQRELAFVQGDIWSKEKIEKSLENLQKLGIFESVHLYPYLSNSSDEQDILVKLVEADPFEVRFRIGFQQVSRNLTFRSGSTYKLGGSIVYRNPCNAGDSIMVYTDFTRFYRNIFALYQRPWIFSQPIMTVLKGYSNKYIQPVFIGSDKPLYQAIQQGFLFGMSRSWLHCDIAVQAGLEVMETNHLSVRLAKAINFEPTLIDKKVPYVYAEPNLVLDYLDNQANPTQGSLTAIFFKIMVPSNKRVPYFVKVVCEQSVFFPILPIVLGFRLRFGHIFNQEFSTIMPPERFYLGGQNSIRSYEPNQGPPLGLYINKHGKKKLVPQGGKSMVNANIECRFPLFWTIGGVIFQDIGTLVEKSLTEIIGGHLLLATGFGLRYYSPVGPLRFDIGWKWRKLDPLESSYAWFLTLGHAF